MGASAAAASGASKGNRHPEPHRPSELASPSLRWATSVLPPAWSFARASPLGSGDPATALVHDFAGNLFYAAIPQTVAGLAVKRAAEQVRGQLVEIAGSPDVASDSYPEPVLRISVTS